MNLIMDIKTRALYRVAAIAGALLLTVVTTLYFFEFAHHVPAPASALFSSGSSPSSLMDPSREADFESGRLLRELHERQRRKFDPVIQPAIETLLRETQR